MKIQSVNAYSNLVSAKNLHQRNHKTSQVAFNGNKGAVVGAVAGSALLTTALVTTIAISGPIGWALTAWVAASGAVGGAALGHSAEEGIKDTFKKHK